MKIEILYSEVCNLAGDSMNHRYLKKCLPQAEFVYTGLNDSPAFASGGVQMVYLGPMSEHTQQLVIERLMPYRGTILKLIEDGTVFLFTGNAAEVLFEEISDCDTGETLKGLGILPFTAKRKLFDRFNSLFLGESEWGEIVGFKHQFTQWYGDNSGCSLARMERGTGINPETPFDGIRRGNLFATQLLGSVLVLNPQFTKYLLTLLGAEPKLAFEDAVREMYRNRLAEFKKPETQFIGH